MKSSRQSAVGSQQSPVVGMRRSYSLHLLTTNDYRMPTMLCLLMILFLSSMEAKAAEREDRWAILIVGSSGDADLRKTYLKEIMDLHEVLTGPLALPRDRIKVLFDQPSENPDLIQFKSTLENLRAVSRDFAGRVNKNDRVFLFIEGHGSYDGKIYKLNLPDADPTAEELAAILSSIPVRQIVVVNATSCSGGSLTALSQAGRVIITATKSGMEKNQTHFGRHFVDAFKNNAADSDKNGRVSIIEAFSFAGRKVEDYYSVGGNLQTEHPVLDDNGDAKAESNPSPENGEGLLARTTYLDAGGRPGIRKSLTPEQDILARTAREIEDQIETLKYAKSEMPEAEYEKRLEELLLKLAQINAKLPQ